MNIPAESKFNNYWICYSNIRNLTLRGGMACSLCPLAFLSTCRILLRYIHLILF